LLGDSSDISLGAQSVAPSDCYYVREASARLLGILEL
jgi:hypothetical protein